MRVVKPSRTLRATLKAIEEEQRRVTSSSAFANSGQSVTSEGQIVQTGAVFVDGGEFTLRDLDGSALFHVGEQVNGDRGLDIHREDGTLAFEMRKAFAPDDVKQMMRGVDSIGRTIFGDALLSPTGFDAPHIPLPFKPVDLTSGARAQSTTSATFVPLFELDDYHQNPALALRIKAYCSNGTMTGEVQVWDAINSVYLDTFFPTPPPSVISIPAGTTTTTTFTSESMILPGSMSDEMRLEVHARVSSGAGTLTVAIARATGYGVQ